MFQKHFIAYEGRIPLETRRIRHLMKTVVRYTHKESHCQYHPRKISPGQEDGDVDG